MEQKQKTVRTDIQNEITNKILAQLDLGDMSWLRGVMTALSPCSFETKRKYTGMNRVLLSTEQFTTPYFVTFLQAKKREWRVTPGLGKNIIFANTTHKYKGKRITDEELKALSAEEKLKVNSYFFMTYKTVWNIQDVIGAEQEVANFLNAKVDAEVDQQAVEMVCAKYTILNNHKNTEASYRHYDDVINMPVPSQFESDAAYHAVLFKEIIRATGHASRLNRKSALNTSDNKMRAYEELVSEIGAAFVFNGLGFTDTNAFKHSLAHINSWVKHMRQDKSFIFRAVAEAQVASNYIFDTIDVAVVDVSA